MKQMKQKKSQKSQPQKWLCKYCDYITSKKSDFTKHLTTPKHQNETKVKQKSQKVAKANFECILCKKNLKSRTTLWRHKKKCVQAHSLFKDEICKKNGFVQKNPENSDVQFLIYKMEKQEKEKEKLWEAFHEQQILLKHAIEQNCKIIPRIGNNNNNNISINVILNEKCKNAMNLEDFVEKLQVSLEDLNYTKENGYVKGLSNIMVKHLKDLPPNDRPIHCSDQKNLHFYVKDEDTWEKDEKNKKVNKSINEIQRKQVLKIKDWTDNHPNYCKDDALYIEYQKMIKSAMCVDTNNIKDIEKNISDIVNIDDVCI